MIAKGRCDVQQRTLVSGVEGHPGEPVGHGQVAVRGHVGDLEIAADKGDHQAERSHQKGQPGGVHRRLSALDQGRRQTQLAGHGPDGGIRSKRQGDPKTYCS